MPARNAECIFQEPALVYTLDESVDAMCGLFFAGFWWVFPLVGLVLCLGMMAMMFRFGRIGGGMCMGANRGDRAPSAPTADSKSIR